MKNQKKMKEKINQNPKVVGNYNVRCNMANIEFVAAPKEIELLDEACFWAMICVGDHLNEIKGVREFDKRDLGLLELMVGWEKLSKKLGKAVSEQKQRDL